jgi:hypothetical protein
MDKNKSILSEVMAGMFELKINPDESFEADWLKLAGTQVLLELEVKPEQQEHKCSLSLSQLSRTFYPNVHLTKFNFQIPIVECQG